MKFLCPVDFSSASINGSEYAAMAARDLNAQLTLVYVQPVYITDGVTMFSMGETVSSKEAAEAQEKLKIMATAIEEDYGVKTNFHVDFSFFQFQNEVAEDSKHYDLIVTGTNGTETLNQFYTGSQSYKLAKLASCPVLIVPEGCGYKKIEKVVFASDYNTDDKLLYEQLKAFLTVFNPKVEIVHISETDSPLSREVFASFSRETMELLGISNDIEFKRIINKNQAEGLTGYMSESNADLLIMCFEKHGPFHSLFHKNLIKKVAVGDNTFPLLLTHK